MATTPAKITIGNDVAVAVQLKRNELPFVIPGTATVKAVLTTLDKKYQLSSIVTCAELESGADWSTSLVVAVFSSAVTALIEYTGMAYIEVQVTDAGKTTFTADVEILAASIP